MLVREDARRKCGEMVVDEIECERGEGRGDVNGMKRGMEGSEGSERSEDGMGKGGKIVVRKRWRKRVMKENGMKMRGNEERVERGKTIKHTRWNGGERVVTKFNGVKRKEWID